MGEGDEVGELVEGERGDGVDLGPGERAALVEQGAFGVGEGGVAAWAQVRRAASDPSPDRGTRPERVRPWRWPSRR